MLRLTTRPLCHTTSSKAMSSWGQSAFPRQVLPPPLRLAPDPNCLRSACAPRKKRGHEITGNLPLKTQHFCCETSVQRPFTIRTLGRIARPKGFVASLRLTRTCSWTERRSSTSATRTIREHNPGILRSSKPTFHPTHPACAEFGDKLRIGLGPHPPNKTSIPGSAQPAQHPEPCGPETRSQKSTSRAYTNQGLADSRRPAPRPRCSRAAQLSFAPIRFTRASLVTKSRQHWAENPAPSIAGRSRTMHGHDLVSQTHFTRKRKA